MNTLQSFDAEAFYKHLLKEVSAAIVGMENITMVGIYSGGAWIADRLAKDCQLATPVGYIDVSFYRDDYAQKGLPTEVKPTHIPFVVDKAHIILVDDVLFTGRTTRAAINELFDYGRPSRIWLAALVDRGQRELPFSADFVGKHITLDPFMSLDLLQDSGPDHAPCFSLQLLQY